MAIHLVVAFSKKKMMCNCIMAVMISYCSQQHKESNMAIENSRVDGGIETLKIDEGQQDKDVQVMISAQETITTCFVSTSLSCWHSQPSFLMSGNRISLFPACNSAVLRKQISAVVMELPYGNWPQSTQTIIQQTHWERDCIVCVGIGNVARHGNRWAGH